MQIKTHPLANPAWTPSEPQPAAPAQGTPAAAVRAALDAVAHVALPDVPHDVPHGAPHHAPPAAAAVQAAIAHDVAGAARAAPGAEAMLFAARPMIERLAILRDLPAARWGEITAVLSPEGRARTLERAMRDASPEQIRALWAGLGPEGQAAVFPHLAVASQATLFGALDREGRDALQRQPFWSPEVSVPIFEAYYTSMPPARFAEAWAGASPEFRRSNFARFSPDAQMHLYAQALAGGASPAILSEMVGMMASCEAAKAYASSPKAVQAALRAGPLADADAIARLQPEKRMLEAFAPLPAHERGLVFALLSDADRRLVLEAFPGAKGSLFSHLPPAERDRLAQSVATGKYRFDTPPVEPAERWLEGGPQTELTPFVRAVAATLRGANDQETLRNIMNFVFDIKLQGQAPLSGVASARDLLAGEGIGGCTESAVLFAALARACGIPTTCLNTVRADWAQKVARGEHVDTAEGHAFVECKVDGAWVLIDPTNGLMFSPHDPKRPVVPGPPSGEAYVVIGRGQDYRDLGIWSMRDLADNARQGALQLPKGVLDDAVANGAPPYEHTRFFASERYQRTGEESDAAYRGGS